MAWFMNGIMLEKLKNKKISDITITNYPLTYPVGDKCEK